MLDLTTFYKEPRYGRCVYCGTADETIKWAVVVFENEETDKEIAEMVCMPCIEKYHHEER